eukprot:403343812
MIGGQQQPQQSSISGQDQNERCKTLKLCFYLFFPNFKLRSVTFIYVITFLLVYIIDEIVYAAKKSQGYQQSYSWACILYYSGAKYTYAISRQGHLYRLIMPMFLHSGFFHIFWNIFSFFMIGFSIEKSIGTWYKYALLLFVGAIGGNIFSAVVDPYNFGVGASTSLFAVLACMCTWFYINYDNLGPMKFQYLIFFGLMVGFAFMNGFLFPGSGVDSWGHMGGFIYGLALSFLLLKGADSEQQKKLDKYRIPSIIFLCIVTLSFTVALFARPLSECDKYNCANICSQ